MIALKKASVQSKECLVDIYSVSTIEKKIEKMTL